MKIIFILCVLLSSCTLNERRDLPDSPIGSLLVSIRFLEGAHSGPANGKTGFYFYVEEPAADVMGPFLNGYEFRNGKMVEEFGGGSGSADVIAEIKKLKFEPFDYALEVEAVNARLKREAEKRGEEYVAGGTRDGAIWELIVVTSAGEFRLQDWNIGSEIEYYAQYSNKISKLNSIVNILMLYHGRMYIGF